MKVKLTNHDRRRHDVILDRSVLRKRALGARRVTIHEHTHDRRTGEVRVRRVTKAVPGVLTLRAGKTSVPLHPQVLAIPQVDRLVRAGKFKVTKIKTEPAPEAEKPATVTAADMAVEPAPEAEKSSRRRRGGKE